jgi:hypothetical protein
MQVKRRLAYTTKQSLKSNSPEAFQL